MQTSVEVEGLLATPQSLTPAANEEFAASSTKPATGWDPFEVWRTRVRGAQQDVAKSEEAPALV